MIDLIKTRRSIRSYRDTEVGDDDLREIIEAGMYAPSAGNEQAWQFIVLKGEILKRYLALNGNVPQSAPTGILVCADRNAEKYKGMNTSYLDCAAATQNMLLAAHAKGLGAIWTAVFDGPKKEVIRLLNLPPGIDPFCFVPVGTYDKTAQEAPRRFDEAKIHRNGW
ncbi:MAG: nitroreductase family protein [Spirochaetes bacterium]|nr:nitroreductase family protein [Spirochaetota bacterium]